MYPTQQTRLAALRDFFLSRSGDDLEQACRQLNKLEKSDAAPADAMDWETAEFAFNRLFVGPMAPEAPPYASCYLEEEPRLMGESTLEIRRIYEMAGLSSPLQGSLPDDHLGLELDAALGLASVAATPGMEAPRALWGYFLNTHLKVWVPRFLEKARNADTSHPALDLALNALEDWLALQGPINPDEKTG